MDILSLFILSCALATDSFAVALCRGLNITVLKFKAYLIVGFYFGGFQAFMTLLGYFLGIALSSFIDSYDHWVAFILLVFIGLKMIKESLQEKDACDEDCEKLNAFVMLPLAIATSIDALAVGISFAFLELNIVFSAFVIGLITFLFCAFGLRIGKQVGKKFSSKAELIGGILLILIGCKILIAHFL